MHSRGLVSLASAKQPGILVEFHRKWAPQSDPLARTDRQVIAKLLAMHLGRALSNIPLQQAAPLPERSCSTVAPDRRSPCC
jgi:hypothetical protein